MNKKRKPILIYLLIIIILAIFIYAVPKVTDAFETTAVLTTGELLVTEEANCYFVRNETVYEAGAAGTVEYLIKEGTHIKTGTKMAKFEANDIEGSEVIAPRSKYAEIIENVGDKAVRTVSFESQSSGIVSYYADGYESTLTPDNMDKFTYEKAQEIQDKAIELKETNVRETEPLLKICDNDNWYIICWVESGSVGRYSVGQDISIRLPEGAVDMVVHDITQDGDLWKITFWSNNYYEAFTQSRVVEGMLISQDYTGLITETGNIITDDGKPVVLVLQQNGDYKIVRVKVKANDGEYSALEDVSFIDEKGNSVSTVNVYDEILKAPSESDLEAAKKAAEKAAQEAAEAAQKGEEDAGDN